MAPQERFASKTVKRESGCIEWTGTPPTMQEIIEMIPAEKRIIVAT